MIEALMADLDRNAILARRALLISAALAGVSCTTGGSQTDPPPPEPAVGEEGPPPVIVEPPPAGEEGGEVGEGARPSWSEVMAKAPPLEVPQDLDSGERERLQSQAASTRSRYEELGKIWETLPSCAPSQAECEAWAEAVDMIQQMTDRGFGPLCGYSHTVTNTYLERQSVHRAYIAQLAQQLLADLDDAVVARANPEDSEAWKGTRARLDQPSAQPCLSCAAPTLEPVTGAVEFELGSAALSDASKSMLEGVHMLHVANRSYGGKLVVRGHASTAEDVGVAQARADAVAAELVKLGVKRKQIEVRSYGASLLITNRAEEDQRNCRVDFEVVE